MRTEEAVSFQTPWGRNLGIQSVCRV